MQLLKIVKDIEMEYSELNTAARWLIDPKNL